MIQYCNLFHLYKYLFQYKNSEHIIAGINFSLTPSGAI